MYDTIVEEQGCIQIIYLFIYLFIYIYLFFYFEGGGGRKGANFRKIAVRGYPLKNSSILTHL